MAITNADTATEKPRGYAGASVLAPSSEQFGSTRI